MKMLDHMKSVVTLMKSKLNGDFKRKELENDIIFT